MPLYAKIITALAFVIVGYTLCLWVVGMAAGVNIFALPLLKLIKALP